MFKIKGIYNSESIGEHLKRFESGNYHDYITRKGSIILTNTSNDVLRKEFENSNYSNYKEFLKHLSKQKIDIQKLFT